MGIEVVGVPAAPALPSDEAIARAERRITMIRDIKRLEWRLWQVNSWALEEGGRLSARRDALLREYEKFMSGDALRTAAEVPK